MMDCEPYPDEMFEEAERREAANRELGKEEWERKVSRFTENPDEIVLEEVEMFHLESMNERSLWVGIYTQNGKTYHLNIHANGDKLNYYWSDETL